MAAPQQTQIPPQLILLLLMPPMIVMVIWTAISTRNPFIFTGVALLPVLIFLLNRLDLWLLVVVCLARSNLKPPGVLGQLELFEVLAAGLVGVLVVRHSILKQAVRREGWMWKFLLIFLAIVVFTMLMRGTGFRFLGDAKWGGMRYVQILLMGLFPFVVWHVQVLPHLWRKALIAMMLLGIVPMVADAIYIFSRGQVFQHYIFIQHGSVVAEVEQLMTGGVTRLRSAGSVGLTLVMLPFFALRPIARNVWKYAIFIAIGLAVASLSGHRLAIVNSAAFAGLYCLYVMRRHRGLLLVALAVATGLVVMFTAMFGRSLPLSVQRAISFIPLANVEPEVRQNAVSTLTWRFRVWKNAWFEEVPEYLWIGKGYAFDHELQQSLVYTNTMVERWASVQVAYHNGPLSLLIGLGIPGLVAGLGLLFTAWFRHWRINRGNWLDDESQRYHTLLFISLTWSTISFTLVYGDVFVTIPHVCFMLGIMEGVYLSDVRAQAAAREQVKSAANEKPLTAGAGRGPIRAPVLRPV